MDKQNVTDVWLMYTAGVNYNNRLEENYYQTVERNYQFFRGNQWIGFESDDTEEDDLPKPVLNFIKRFIQFFVASLTTSNLKLHLSPYLQSTNVDNQGMTKERLTEMVNSHVDFLLEKFKMEYKLRESCFDSAITGDAAMHFYFDPSIKPYGAESGDIEGEIVCELVDGVNIIFGNANIFDKEAQPYILVLGRDTIASLRKEAIDNGLAETDAGQIVADSEYQYQASDLGFFENEDIDEYRKALFIYCYRRDPDTGTIRVSKSTQSVMIFDEVDTGLTKYPVAFLNWQKKKNTYHGTSVAGELIETQVFVNQMAAMIMLHLMSSAFPKIVYDVNAFPNGIDNRVGRSIAVDNLSDRPVNTLIDTIQPAAMSNQIIQALDTIIGYFKETAGISDAALGQINNPKNNSAIVAIQQASSVPLGNVAANLSEYMESIGEIIVDMMGVYYNQRPLVMKQEDGTRTLQDFDFSQLKNIWLNVNCDVTQSTKYSEAASIQTLSNLLNGKYLDVIQFLERMPEGYIKDKDKLIDEFKAKQAQAQAAITQPPMPNQPPQPQPQQPNVDAILAHLSPHEQQAFLHAHPDVQQKLLTHATGAHA